MKTFATFCLLYIISITNGQEYCSATHSGCTNDYIRNVELNTLINLNTVCSGDAYTFYSNITTELKTGNTYNLYITSGLNSGNYYRAWLDYNDDGDFYDANEALGVVQATTSYQRNFIQFTIPPNTNAVKARLRIRCLANSSFMPCSFYTLGETEDYEVLITSDTTSDFTEIPTDLNNNERLFSFDWGDFNNDGFRDLLIATNTGSPNYECEIQLYKNNGNQTFSSIEIYAPIVKYYEYENLHWCDFNNDNYLDFICVSKGYLSIYQNNGDESFTKNPITIEAESTTVNDYNHDGLYDIITCDGLHVYKNIGNFSFALQSSISFEDNIRTDLLTTGDYNNDGYDDILRTGTIGYSDEISYLYQNNYNNIFTLDTNLSLPGITYSSVAWGDYNSDGWLDILMNGRDESNSRKAALLRNYGGDSLVYQSSLIFDHTFNGCVAWGDCNNDGYLDAVITGDSARVGYNNKLVTKVYINNGNNTFSQLTTFNFEAVYLSFVNWIDYDNDGDLDIFLTGRNEDNEYVSRLYRNNITTTNTPPQPPANLSAILTGNSATLSWDKSTDTETPQDGLSYNIYISEYPGAINIVSPNADLATGWRKISQRGITHRNSYTINDLKAKQYYWSVQAIDNNYAGSAFATESSFTITFDNTLTPETDQFIASGQPGDTIHVNETVPVDNRQWKYSLHSGGPYTDSFEGENDNYFIPLILNDTSYYLVCVSYVGTDSVISDEIKIEPFTFKNNINTNIAGTHSGTANWVDFNNDSYSDMFLTGYDSTGALSSTLYRNNGDGSFAEQTSIDLPGIVNSSVDLTDINHDNLIDLVLCGNSNSGFISKVFRNNGDSTFSEETGISLPGLSNASVAWGDYNNDGNPDILLTGKISDTPFTPYSRIYTNIGNNTFAENTFVSLINVDNGSAAWIDYDNDGDLDIFISGYNDIEHTVSRIYMNNGDNTFTEQSGISIDGVSGGAIAWGDYNNDNYFDLAICGYNFNVNGPITKLYVNNGNNTFTEQTHIEFTPIYSGSLAWGDYNNDSYTDLLLSGENPSQGYISEVYKNNGNNTFEKISNTDFIGLTNTSTAWCDYDNDRDLDVLLSGFNGTNPICKIFENTNPDSNEIPGTPGVEIAELNGSEVTLNWGVQPNHTYNLRIGHSPDASDILSSNSIPGSLIVPENGNMGFANNFTIKNLPVGSYYVSIQAVNNGYIASEFSPAIAFENYFVKSDVVDLSQYEYPFILDIENDGDLDILVGDSIYCNEISHFTTRHTKFDFSIRYNGDYPSAWNDLDNDGDMDYVRSFAKDYINNDFRSVIYENQGNYNIIEDSSSLQGIWMGSMALGDYNTDGNTDLFLYGSYESSDDGEPVGVLLQNNENFSFSNTEIDIRDYRRGAVDIGDYNKDGYPDILSCGSDLSANSSTSILRNNGDNTFTKIYAGLEPFTFGVAKWADFDNDGYLDIYISGDKYCCGGGTGKIYKNTDGTSFSDIGINFSSTASYTVKSDFGDYDNDGDLDIITDSDVYRNDGNNNFTKVFIGPCSSWADLDNDGDLDCISSSISYNTIDNTNNPPEIPTGVEAFVSGNQVIIHWNASTDDHTPSAGISYNLRIGNSPGACNILSAMVDSSFGYKRLLTGMGNAGIDTFKIIRNLEQDTFYCSVQAIDNSWQASEFSTEISFLVLPMYTKISEGSFYGDNGSWADYDNDGDLDLVHKDGSKLEIYNNEGNDSFVLDTSFTILRNSSFIWRDIDNNNYLDIVCSDTIYRNDTTHFTSVVNNQPFGVFGDYDADGDEDIIYTEDSKLHIYRNDRDTSATIIELDSTITGFRDWFDYDNDSDLDLLTYTTAYKNLGNDTFANINAGFIELSDYSNNSFADYDNDSYLDVFISGYAWNEDYHSILYKNMNDDSFYDIKIDIRGYNDPKVFWGDHNDDGRLDIIISGWNNGGTRNKLYINQPDGIFTEEAVDNIVKYIDIFCVGDYDSDGDLDAFTNEGIFRNNTNTPYWKPQAVSNLSSKLKGFDCQLSWDKATEKNGNGFSYNVRIGTAPNVWNIKSPALTPESGNVPSDTNFTIRNLSSRWYYWCVQAINGVYTKGYWSEIDSFLITDVSPDFHYNTVCLGSPTTFVDLSVTTDSIIKWQWLFGDGNTSSEQNPNHLYAYADTFDVTLWAYTESGDSASRKHEVIVLPAPIAAFTVMPVCKGESSTLLDQSDTSQVVVKSWLWKYSNGDSSLYRGDVQEKFDETTTVSLTITAENGCTSTDINLAEVIHHPVFDISLANVAYNTSFCEQDSTILVVPTIDECAYRWQKDGGNIGVSDTFLIIKGSFATANTYSVEIETNVANCLTEEFVEITINENPPTPHITIPEGYHDVLCKGDTCKLTTPILEGFNYTWYKNDNLIAGNVGEYFASDSGIYSIKVTSAENCINLESDSIGIQLVGTPETPNISPSDEQQLCAGDSVTLSVDNHANLVYNWYTNNGLFAQNAGNQIHAKQSDQYYVVVTNSDDCSKQSQNTVRVNVNPRPPAPYITASGGTIICDNQTSQLVFNGIADNYHWLIDGQTTSNNQATFTPNQSARYRLVIQNSEGCYSDTSNTVDMEIYKAPLKPTISTTGNNPFCQGESLLLAIEEVDNGVYSWLKNGSYIPSANNRQYSTTETGSYTAELSLVYDEITCSLISDSKSIIAFEVPKPVLNYSNSIDICPYDSTVLRAINPLPEYKYQWEIDGAKEPGETNYRFNGTLQQGNYSLIRMSSDGTCPEESDNLKVNLKTEMDKPTITVFGPNIWYMGVNNNSAANYRWFYNFEEIDDENRHMLLADQNLGTYYASITDGSGCWVNSDTVEIPTDKYKSAGEFTLPTRIDIFPNPTSNGIINIELIGSYTGNVVLEITDMKGDRVLIKTIQKGRIKYMEHLSFKRAPGFYLLSIKYNGKVESRSFVVE